MLPPVPRKSNVLSTIAALIARDWDQWFIAVARASDTAAQRIGQPVDLADQAAALPATTVAQVPTDGLYRISFYVRVTQPASVSSSVSVLVRWTDGGVALAAGTAALTTNTTGTFATLVFLVAADQGTTVTVETTYASVGGTPMQYRLDVRVESVP
jgi:hypothetical protein